MASGHCPVAGPGWREHLPRLEAIGAVLLPIGAGPPDRKYPVDASKGMALTGISGWQQHPGFTAAQIAAMDPGPVIGACINTGPSGLAVLDIDGAAAVQWLEARGLNPRDPALFRITRTTDPDRFKILFRPTEEQRKVFPPTKGLLRVGEPRRVPGKSRPVRDALEVYAKEGAQVIVLGYHSKSGGWYDWAGDPSQIAAPSDEWLDAIVAIKQAIDALRGQGDTSRPPRGSGGGGRWSVAYGPSRPCPICGRNTSRACTGGTSSDGRPMIACYQGATFYPPEGLKPGDVVQGRDGRTYAFSKQYYAESLGDKSLFIEHNPSATRRKPSRQVMTAQPVSAFPDPFGAPPATPQDGGQPQPSKAPAFDQARLKLKDLLAEGLSGSALATKVLELAEEYECHASLLFRVVNELQTEDDATLQADAELEGIRRAGELEEERKTFTLEQLVPAQCVAPLRYLSTSLQVDDLATAMIFLTCASAAIRAGTRIWGDEISFAERPQIWLGLVGKSGLGKSPAMRNLGVTPTHLVKRHYHHRNQERQAEWLTSNPDARGPEPSPYVFQISNYTAGAIVKQFAVNEEERLGVLLACDELAALFSSLNEFQSKGRGSEQEQLLSLFDNNGDAQIRVKEGYRSYDEAHLSIIGGIQPLVFDQLASHGDPAGLFARLLLLPLPTDYRGDERPAGYSKEATHNHQATLENVVVRVLGLPPAGYQLSKDAEEFHRSIRRSAHKLADRSALVAHSNIYGKRAGYVLRIAGVMHILRVAAGEVLPVDAQVVTLATVELADKLVTHLQAYALSAQTRAAAAAEGTITELMRAIHKYALDNVTTAGKFRSNALSPAKRKLYSIQSIVSYVQRLVDDGLAEWIPSAGGSGSRSFIAKGRLPG